MYLVLLPPNVRPLHVKLAFGALSRKADVSDLPLEGQTAHELSTTD